MRTAPLCSGSKPIRARLGAIVLAGLLLLLNAHPSYASHANIVVDGDLTDLISVVNANLGGAAGGFKAVDPLGDVYTQACAYVNGYDIRETYAFFDFHDTMGNPLPDDVTLYLGWVVEGLIGDVDGDGNPDTFSIGGPGGSSGCALSDEPGIGSNESYNLQFDLDCSGPISDVRVAVLSNMVGIFNGATFMPLPGATFAVSGHNLEVRIPDYQNLLDGLNLTGVDLCDAQVHMTANAEFDGPGEDFVSPPFQLEVPPEVSITKLPPTQLVCSGENAEWRIVVSNTGMCLLNEITVTDTLESGLSFISSNPPSTGTSQYRTWQFANADLAPGDSIVIQLAGSLGGQCPAGPLTNIVAVEVVHTSTCLEQPVSANARDTALVSCRNACLTARAVDEALSSCAGTDVTAGFYLRNCGTVDAFDLDVVTSCGDMTPVNVSTIPAVLGAGDSVLVEVTCRLPAVCSPTADYSIRLDATGTIPGVECSDQASATADVTCAAPCLQVEFNRGPNGACPGDTFAVVFDVRNCSATATESITLVGLCNISTPAFDVTPTSLVLGPNSQQEVRVRCIMPAQCHGEVPVRLNASTSVGAGAGCTAEATQSHVVQCMDVCLNAMAPNDTTICSGETYTGTFMIQNCNLNTISLRGRVRPIGSRTAGGIGPIQHYVLTATCNGQPLVVTPPTLNLAAGEKANVAVACAMPVACTGPLDIDFKAVASLVDDPGCTDSTTVDVRVDCGEACIDVVACQTQVQGCAGEPVQVPFVVRNCSAGTNETVTVSATCGGSPVTLPISTYTIGSGDSVTVTVPCTMPNPCTGNLNVQLTAHGHRAGSPANVCADTDVATCTVTCGSVCVAVNNPPAVEACPGDTVEIPFTVSNCGNTAFNVNMMAACNGQIVDTVTPFNFDLNPGQSRISTVTCVVPEDCRPGQFLTVVNSAWANKGSGCAMDIAGNTRINCIECPVNADCGPLVLVAPPQAGTCPNQPVQVTFTVENQGQSPVDVYIKTPTAGWTLNPTVINNLASGVSTQVTASRPAPPASPQQLVLRAWSYPVSTTPADTAGMACAFASDAVDIVPGATPCVRVSNPSPIDACPGDTVEIPFTVSNCGNLAFNVNMVAACNGQIVNTVTPFNFDLNPGQSRISTVTCVVPEDCDPGEFLTVVNSAWANKGSGCAADTAGNGRINCVACPVGGSCGPLALVAPSEEGTCPGQPVQIAFTVENQGESPVDVYVKTPTAGWTLNPTVINNLASGVPTQVTASRAAPPASSQQLILRATSYPASSTPADTAGKACATGSDAVNIVPDSNCGPPLAAVCPRTIGFWRQQTQQKDNGSRKICEADAADVTDMQRLWREVIEMTDVVSFWRNDGSTVTVTSMASHGDDELFDALGCELEGPRPMTQRNMAEIQYLALLLNVAAGLVDLDTPVDNGSFHGTIGEAIDEIESILNQSNAGNSQLSKAGGIADDINNGRGLRGTPCEGGENGPFAGGGNSCPSSNAGFVCPDEDAALSVSRVGPVPTGQLALSAVPNPFNPTAMLHWAVRPDQVGQRAAIDVFDAAGRTVAHVFDGVVTSESNELLLAPDGWSSGMYIARLTVGQESIVYRLVLVK